MKETELLAVLKTALEHAEGKGWRSDHVRNLLRNTIVKLEENKMNQINKTEAIPQFAEIEANKQVRELKAALWKTQRERDELLAAARLVESRSHWRNGADDYVVDRSAMDATCAAIADVEAKTIIAPETEDDYYPAPDELHDAYMNDADAGSAEGEE